MPIAVNANCLQHWPSPTMRQNVFHSTHSPRRSGKFVTPGSQASNVLSIFRFLTSGGLLLGLWSPKGEVTYYPLRTTILQNFSPIAQTMFEICVTEVIQSLALIFDPSMSPKVKCDGADRKPVGPTTKYYQWSNLISVTVFEIFRVKILTVDLMTLAGLTPGPMVTNRGDDLLST